VNWGPWGEVGRAASLSEQDKRRYAERGIRLITPEEGTGILGLLLGQDVAQVGAFRIDWGAYAPRLADGAPAPLFRNLARGNKGGRADARRQPQGDAALRGRLEAAADSLMIVELRNHRQASLGKSLPSTLVFEHPTIEALSNHIASEVLSFGSGPAAAAPTPTPADVAAVGLDALSSKELEDSLLKEVKEAGY
jgi:hypothetical protein